MWVYRVFNDPVLFECLEADLLENYGYDIYDYFRGKTYCRRLVTMIFQLPNDSRLSRRVRNDPLMTSEHLLLSAVDFLNRIAFESMNLTSATVGGKIYKKDIQKHVPKPTPRPTYDSPTEEEKPKRKFLSGRELKAMFGGEEVKTRITDQTNEE